MADDKTFTKDELDAAIDAAVTKATGDLEGLKANLKDALDEAKEAKRKLRTAAEVTPEVLTAAEDRADKAEAALTQAQKDLKAATTDKDKAVKALEAEQGVTHKLVADSGLRELLLKGGVTDPDFLDMAVGKYLPNVKVVVEGDARKAMHGDKELSAFVTELLASDAGKKIVTAAANSGGGAPGGKGGEGGADLSKLPPVERITAARAAGVS